MHGITFQKTGLLRMSLLALLWLFYAPFAQAQGCSQPSNLNSVVSPGAVALSWSTPGGATSFVVQYRIGNSGVWINGGNVATPNVVLGNLQPMTVYSWRVRANCSTFSSVAFFNSGGGVGGNVACSQPSNLNALVTSPTSANLDWSAIEGALFYRVQYRLGSVGTWTNAGSVTGTSITLNNLALNSEYTWRVQASCSVYSSVASFNTGSTGGGNTECSQPSNQEALILSNTSATLSWSGIQEAFDYTVEYRLGLSGAWINAGTVTGTSLTLNNLTAGATYSWRVKASCSVFSSEAVFTMSGGSTGGGNGGGSTSCSAPSNTNVVAVFPTSANIEWEPQGGALNYTVQYRVKVTQGAFTTLGTFTGSTATITGLSAGVEYEWRVKANCSPYGSEVSFTTPFAFTGMTLMQAGAKAGLSAFPNPVKFDEFQLRSQIAGAQLSIINAAGQVVATQVLNDMQQTINVSSLQNGVYFLRVQSAKNAAQTLKLVIAR
jgi:Secretion system C-terminal sorting domain/Fibronectin type III domain